MTKDQETILFFAFRYALGRRTYAVSIMVETLQKEWENLSDHIQCKIKSEIKTAIETDCAGDGIDIKEWEKLSAQRIRH